MGGCRGRRSSCLSVPQKIDTTIKSSSRDAGSFLKNTKVIESAKGALSNKKEIPHICGVARNSSLLIRARHLRMTFCSWDCDLLFVPIPKQSPIVGCGISSCAVCPGPSELRNAPISKRRRPRRSNRSSIWSRACTAVVGSLTA